MSADSHTNVDSQHNQQWLLISRPTAEPTLDNFRFVEVELTPLVEGQVRIRNQYLSLDPYMRGRMSDAKSYAPPQPLNEVMIGGTVGEVVESKHPKFQPGDCVVATGGWQLFTTLDATQPGALRKIPASSIPRSAFLGVCGMPGITAWYGLNKICEPKPGETVVVSSASGAVGSVVGQLAKLQGCRAVGIAGGPDKCRYVIDELGFDDCIDYKAHHDLKALSKALAIACPQGIDCDFENVGGHILDAVIARMNSHGRIALCGTIAGYNGEPIPLQFPQLILLSRLKIQGFIVSEHLEYWPEAISTLTGLVSKGQLKYRETVSQGLKTAPAAFFNLLKGQNFGKQLVKLI